MRQADLPIKTPDTNVKNAALQTGKQTFFIALLQAKNSFFTIHYIGLIQLNLESLEGKFNAA